MTTPKTPKMEANSSVDDELSMSRSQLYARLQAEKRRVANFEKENIELKSANSTLSQKVDIIKKGMKEIVSAAIGDISAGVKSLKAMAYDIERGCSEDETKKRRDIVSYDTTFVFDDGFSRRTPLTPKNTPMVHAPTVHGSESMRRMKAVLICSPEGQKFIPEEVFEEKSAKKISITPAHEIETIDVTAATKFSSIVEDHDVKGVEKDTEGVEDIDVKLPAVKTTSPEKVKSSTIVEDKTPKRIPPTSAKSPIREMVPAHKPSVDSMKRRVSNVHEMPVVSKVARTDGVATTVKPSNDRSAVIQKKPMTATGRGSGRDKMDPALVSSSTRRIAQPVAPVVLKPSVIKKSVSRRETDVTKH